MFVDPSLSPLMYNSSWKDIFPTSDKQKTCDEFLDMYTYGERGDHKLTSMFSKPDLSNGKLDKVNGVKKQEAPVPPLVIEELVGEMDEAIDRREMSDDDDDEVGDQKGGRRKLNKGLKLLSVIVKDIVEEKRVATYKEVADIILRANIKFEGLHLNSKIEVAREEQNVKRRVYDALNVLISAGVLVKEGKYVRNNPHTDKMIVSYKRLSTNTLRSKIVSLREKQEIHAGRKAEHPRYAAQENQQHPRTHRPQPGQPRQEVHQLSLHCR